MLEPSFTLIKLKALVITKIGEKLMKYYIDTGNLAEIETALSQNLIDGITTNPTLVMKEGKDFKFLLTSISKLLKQYKVSKDFTVSAEVTAPDTKGMVAQGKELAKIDPHIIVKIPMTIEGLQAVRELAKFKIRCNVTLCFSVNQAVMAAKAGAFIVSPFIGRLDDSGEDGSELIERIRVAYDNYGYQTQILAASIRTENHVENATLSGSDIATIPNKVLTKLITHPLTKKGLEQFNKDWETFQKGQKK